MNAPRCVCVNLICRQGYVLATVADPLKREFLNQIKGATCNGVAVSAFAGCINDGEMCSSVGTCNSGRCTCPSSRTGQYCELIVSSSSSDSTVIVLGTLPQRTRTRTRAFLTLLAFVCSLATVLPVSGFLVCLGLLVVLVVVLVAARLRHRGDSYDWEIRLDELELGEQLASGGFGQVYRATWKGTEVAVKVMASEQVTREMERQFKEEVRVMTSLRHPNVVLFMAACTKAPKMCIVMEFMSLGSLHDVRCPPPLLFSFAFPVAFFVLLFPDLRPAAAQRAGLGHSVPAEGQDGLPGLQGNALPPLLWYVRLFVCVSARPII
jgi:hypothetical protein